MLDREQKFKDHNPMRDETNYISKEDIDRMIDTCVEERDALLIHILSRTGRRISEVVRGSPSYPEKQHGIRMTNIDFDSNQIYFRILKKNPLSKEDRAKGEEKEEPPLKVKYVHPDVMERLRAYTDKHHFNPRDFIFPMTRQRAFQIIRDVADKCNVRTKGGEKINTKTFRHSFAVHSARSAESPADLVHIKNLLEHSSIEITKHYLKFDPEDQMKILRKTWD